MFEINRFGLVWSTYQFSFQLLFCTYITNKYFIIVYANDLAVFCPQLLIRTYDIYDFLRQYCLSENFDSHKILHRKTIFFAYLQFILHQTSRWMYLKYINRLSTEWLELFFNLTTLSYKRKILEKLFSIFHISK